jgi:hypothetical protein
VGCGEPSAAAHQGGAKAVVVACPLPLPLSTGHGAATWRSMGSQSHMTALADGAPERTPPIPTAPAAEQA